MEVTTILHALVSPVVVAVLVILLTTTLVWQEIMGRRRKQGWNDPTRLPSFTTWVPYLGHAIPYFSVGPFAFVQTMYEKAGRRPYFIYMLGKPALVLFDHQDIKAALTASEKSVSLFKANLELINFAFPKEDMSQYPSSQLRQLISAGPGGWEGVSGLPIVFHAVRKEKMVAWIPGIRQVIQHQLDRLLHRQHPEHSGQFDLFELCNNIVSAITVRVLLGDVVLKDPDLLPTYVKLFHLGDPEAGFKGPHRSLTTLMECFVFGERRIFRQVRDLLRPFLHDEIRAVLQGAPEPEDASVMSSYVRYWYQRLQQQQGENFTDASLWAAEGRIFNDLFLFTFAAFTNSYAGAAWLLYHMMENTNGIGERLKSSLQVPSPQQSSAIDQTTKTEDAWFVPEVVENTLLEIARLYTPGNAMRETMTPWKMPSTQSIIPVGTLLLLPQGCLSRSAELYEDPLKFDPDRYSSNRQEHKKAGHLFMAFGSGSHPCLGRRFANLEIFMFVSEIMRSYDLTLVQRGPCDSFTQAAMGQPDHPRLDPRQAGFLWRPIDPMIVQYRRK